MPPKYIAVICIALDIKGHNLLDLPKRMHWHVSVGLRTISLPENEVECRILLSEIVKSIAQVLDIV